MALTGTSGGQDAAKRAAMIRYAGGVGRPAGPSMGSAPAPQADSGSVTEELLSAAQRTVSEKDKFQENLSAWKQALAFLAANLPPDALQGGGDQSAISPAMGQMSAQGAPMPQGPMSR